MRVAVLSGYNKSLHTIALLHELSKREEIELCLCILVRTFTVKRVKSLLKQYGFIQAKRRFSNIFLGHTDPDLDRERKPLENFLADNQISKKTVTESCKKLNIRLRNVDNINSEMGVIDIKQQNTDLVLYSGGGIIRKDLIMAAKRGVLNAHGARLPFFRGMNGVEWSLFYNELPMVSVHLVDTGIDCGEILNITEIKIDNDDDISSIRGKSALTEMTALVDSVTNFEKYYQARVQQTKEEGKQFFAMHPKLKKVAAENLFKLRNE